MTDTALNLTPFEIFIISGGNPANHLPALCRLADDTRNAADGRLFFSARTEEVRKADAETACGPIWAVLLLGKLHGGETWQPGLDPQTADGKLTQLGRWAVVESLNEGSHQRADLPAEISAALIGSGRWHANDSGGHFQFLRDAVLTWCRLSSESQWKFRDAAKLLAIPRAVLSALVPVAEARRAAGKRARAIEALRDHCAWAAAGDALSVEEANLYAALTESESESFSIECDGDDRVCDARYPACSGCTAQDFRFQGIPKE